jgi:hypothetical protein
MYAESPPLQIIMPLTQEGNVVRLEPIRSEYARLFWEAAQ